LIVTGTFFEVHPVDANVTLPAAFLTVTVNVTAAVPVTLFDVGAT
jgi:hypothetical protein